ncbi:MAG: hypothetical protein UY13_C0002G0121 [Candidatus Pacebacteria bacterium GW2011_GWB1_47_8]|nr:MAG: hypothetical protein UX28_C0001G0270 [Candidatus Pacebacteria bacterium GW2011_GWA1_46_10]KKU84209.1 MAG: hypothetical protein UY13_C0002G0121 [Candidatus Pacebacteria bacterium GW2011_GWB1_47_8]HCR81341.1 hypothetical protein [Candidatus Paceibacterota bacterium]
MLDTVVLTLSKGMYYIKEPDRFEPSARLILDENSSMGSRGYIPAKQNPTKRELQSGIYKPRLTLTNRFNHTGRREATLKIELSLPKLLFGNNFDELSIDDFDPVTKLLKSRLKDMGVMVWEKFLLNAPVSAIHYSKNIPLTDGSTPHYLISKINEANIKLSLDINQTDYRNDGHSYKWHANSYEVAFYDKIKDLEMAKKSEKRAVERDNALQLSLFDTFEKRKQLEVLRMEVRLNKRQKIKQLFRTLGIQSELTYKNLFSPSISQQVLLHYLDEVESKRLPLFDYKPTSPKSLLADLIINNSRLGLKKTVQLYGLKQIFNDITPRELRTMFSGYSQRSWYRLIAEAKTVKLPPSKSPLEVIREHLTNFEPLKLVDFQDTMLNNDKYN